MMIFQIMYKIFKLLIKFYSVSNDINLIVSSLMLIDWNNIIYNVCVSFGFCMIGAVVNFFCEVLNNDNNVSIKK